jgi:metal-dependent amidase/aminoacylase/carboxypeptidase family protein
VIPEDAFLEGTVRAMTETVRDDIQQSLEQLATDTAKAYGCEAVFEYERGPAPVINDAELCDRAAVVARELGLIVKTNPSSMIAEDFSKYLKLAPGALFRIGTGGGFDNHHPSFTADPSALLPAARFFATLAPRELERLSKVTVQSRHV